MGSLSAGGLDPFLFVQAVERNNFAMKRLRALLLLGALLTNPVGIVAAMVFPASDCCCCGAGGMCPMHHDQKSQKEKIPCQGGNQAQNCMCAPSQQTQPVIQQVLPEAIVSSGAVLPLPVLTQEIPRSDFKFTLARFTSPPEQPPRQ